MADLRAEAEGGAPLFKIAFFLQMLAQQAGNEAAERAIIVECGLPGCVAQTGRHADRYVDGAVMCVFHCPYYSIVTLL